MGEVTSEKIAAFYDALSETCNVGRACRKAGFSRMHAYRMRGNNEDFKRGWDRALAVGLSALEDEAHRRAFEGDRQPVFRDGEEIGEQVKYSDTLAIFLLKAHAPDKYRENTRMELGGIKGQPLEVSDTTAAAKVAALLARAEARRAGEPEDISDLA